MTQELLFRRRVSSRLPANPVGQDIAFRCFTDDGLYYCKADKNDRPIRATEWISIGLAQHLGLSVAPCAVIEDDDGATYFGSRSPNSFADEMEVIRILTTPVVGELGQPTPWLGQYLARLNAFDLFVDNPDRNLRNFILDRDGFTARLCAIDFASARLMDFSVDRFPVESEQTLLVRSGVRRLHGSHVVSAMEMLDRIAAIPDEVIFQIVGQMPDDWMTRDQKKGLGAWSSGRRRERIARLRVVLEHEADI